jgi:predicted ATPase/DNA-binding CsgD family transcriptional regulator
LNNIIGRTKEKNYIFNALDGTKAGRGQIILISGEAGIGKTSLVEETLSHSELKIYIARCNNSSAPAYGPLINILRNCMNQSNDKLDCGGLTKYLPLILPELGDTNIETDAETIKETFISAFLNMAKNPTAIFIDDIQWIDDASIELLTAISDRITSKSLIIICSYIDSEITRYHLVKKFKNELRRRRKLNEIHLEPLNRDETGLVISALLKSEPDESLIDNIFSITQGLPLFVEELIYSLEHDHLLTYENEKVALVPNAEIKISENLKDAVINQLNNISPEARGKLEIASVVGIEFNPEIIIKLSGSEAGFDELFEKNLIKEIKPDYFSFNHSVKREVIKDHVIWSRRKALHGEIAQYLELKNANPQLIAEHWFSAGEPDEAKKHLLLSADLSSKVFAYSDAARSLHKALSFWSADNESELRIKTLLKYAQYSHLSGNLNESIKAIKEIIESSSLSDKKLLGKSYRLLATVYSVLGNIELSVQARLKSAEAFYQSDNLVDSASELLVAAGKYTALLKLDLAYDMATNSALQAEQVNRKDISTQAKALAGNILAMQGKFEEGKSTVQDALSEAVKNNLSDAASMIYRRLASTMEFASDYSSAREAYYSAYNFCISEGKQVSAQICLGCMSYTLFQTGEWKRSLEICDDVIKNINTPVGSILVGYGMKGIIFALRGETKKAIKNLNKCTQLANKEKVLTGEMYTLWGNAIISEYEKNINKTADYYRSILDFWKKTEDKHDIILILIWGASFYSRFKFKEELTRCTEILSDIASQTGNTEAVAGLAFALGENFILNDDYEQAVRQYKRSLEFIDRLQVPLLQMLLNFRIGQAVFSNQDEITGRKYFFNALSISKNLAVRPFTSLIEETLFKSGTRPEESRKSDSEERSSNAGLTRRQLEILVLIAEGFTNKEIADKLFLSTRTVDMHVSHILERLNCRTRIDAINKAKEAEII